MLEGLVASLLNRFLGGYVSNLNYDQLKIGIWNGKNVINTRPQHYAYTHEFTSFLLLVIR
jgi:hypothetical protein